MALSNGPACKHYFLQIPIKVCGACTSKIMVNKANTSTQLISTVVASMSMDEMLIVILFL